MQPWLGQRCSRRGGARQSSLCLRCAFSFHASNCRQYQRGRFATPRPPPLKETRRLGFLLPDRKESRLACFVVSARPAPPGQTAHGRRRQRLLSTVTHSPEKFKRLMYRFTIAHFKTVDFKVHPVKPRIQTWKQVFLFSVFRNHPG